MGIDNALMANRGLDNNQTPQPSGFRWTTPVRHRKDLKRYPIANSQQSAGRALIY